MKLHMLKDLDFSLVIAAFHDFDSEEMQKTFEHHVLNIDRDFNVVRIIFLQRENLANDIRERSKMMLQNVEEATAFQDEKHDFVDSNRLRESTKMSDFIMIHEHVRKNYVTVIIVFFQHHALT